MEGERNSKAGLFLRGSLDVSSICPVSFVPFPSFFGTLSVCGLFFSFVELSAINFVLLVFDLERIQYTFITSASLVAQMVRICP